MNLSINPTSQSFRARTSIIAPESLISKEAVKSLVEKGKKMGDDRSSITLTATDLNDKVFKMSQNVFIATKDKPFVENGNIIVPKAKYSVESYAKVILGRLAKLF